MIRPEIFFTGALFNQGADQHEELRLAEQKLWRLNKFKINSVRLICEAMDASDQDNITQAMKLRGVFLMRSDILVNHNNYEQDPYAVAEVNYARAIGIPVMNVEKLLEKYSKAEKTVNAPKNGEENEYFKSF